MRHQLAQEEFITKQDSELHFSKYAALYNAHDIEAMRENIYYQLDNTCNQKGEELFTLTQKLPLKDEYGKIYGVLGLTQLIKIEDAHTILLRNHPGKNIKLAIDQSCFSNFQMELSSRELEVLYLFLQGKSTKTTATVLNISERTVIFHLNNIKSKWNCNSKEEIYQLAKKKGLISFSALRLLLAPSASECD